VRNILTSKLRKNIQVSRLMCTLRDDGICLAECQAAKRNVYLNVYVIPVLCKNETNNSLPPNSCYKILVFTGTEISRM